MDSVRKETHEYIREGSSFERALKNMSLLDLGRTRVLVSFTLMRSNVQEYPAMIQFCQERGYHMSVFPMILRSETGVLPFNLIRESLWFDREHLEPWLKQFYGAGYGRMVGTAAGASDFVDEFSCNSHYQDLNMDSEGNVNLCGKLSLGNLASGSLGGIWKSSEAEEFRLQVETDRAPCMTCDYRQRCLSPSMALLENHFSEEITAALSAETRHAIRYDRTISDEEAQWLFVRDVGNKVGVFEVSGADRTWSARKVSARETPGEYHSGDSLGASSRHELHDLMRRDANSAFDVQLLESWGRHNLVKYNGRFWALPLTLGHLNITREADRRKPGILSADTVDELKAACGPPIDLSPVLLESLNGYNLVAYDGQFWAIPVAFGPYDLTQPENQTRDGIIVSPSLDHLQQKCAPFPMLPKAQRV
jgi:radical SAM protein with 4Fe4S-binding SPASM domain